VGCAELDMVLPSLLPEPYDYNGLVLQTEVCDLWQARIKLEENFA
jgi:hypothetical protein